MKLAKRIAAFYLTLAAPVELERPADEMGAILKDVQQHNQTTAGPDEPGTVKPGETCTERFCVSIFDDQKCVYVEGKCVQGGCRVTYNGNRDCPKCTGPLLTPEQRCRELTQDEKDTIAATPGPNINGTAKEGGMCCIYGQGGPYDGKCQGGRCQPTFKLFSPCEVGSPEARLVCKPEGTDEDGKVEPGTAEEGEECAFCDASKSCHPVPGMCQQGNCKSTAEGNLDLGKGSEAKQSNAKGKPECAECEVPPERRCKPDEAATPGEEDEE